jgi:hypothetical protein
VDKELETLMNAHKSKGLTEAQYCRLRDGIYELMEPFHDSSEEVNIEATEALIDAAVFEACRLFCLCSAPDFISDRVNLALEVEHKEAQNET